MTRAPRPTVLAKRVPDPPTAQPSRIAVDETAIRIGREQFWFYAALDIDSKLLLGVGSRLAVRLQRWRGASPIARPSQN